MRRSVKVLGAIGLILVVAGVAYYFFFANKNASDNNGDVVLRNVPDFTLPNAAGMGVTLSEIDAEIKVVNFWASWSPYSKDELQALVDIRADYGTEVAVVALNRDTTPADGQAFLESLEVGSELLFVYDEEDAYFKQVGGYAVPETLFLDRDGNVLAHIHAPMTEQQMRVQLDALLSGMQ